LLVSENEKENAEKFWDLTHTLTQGTVQLHGGFF